MPNDAFCAVCSDWIGTPAKPGPQVCGKASCKLPPRPPATAGAAGPETDSMASRFTPMDEAMHRDLLDRAEAVVWHAGELGVPLGGWSGTTKWAVALVTLEATHRARVATLEARLRDDEAIFRWLLGEDGEFPESVPGRRYNFRTELRARLAARATPRGAP